MSAAQAKKCVAEVLSRHGIAYQKLTGRTVSFSDLARGGAVAVKVHGLEVPDPRIKSVKEELPRGVILDLPGP